MRLSGESTVLSVVVPLFNEQENLPRLVAALNALRTDVQPIQLQVILVDDGSADDTYAMALKLLAGDPAFTLVKLAGNYGSHAAVAAGMTLVSGDCAVFLAGDLQDPLDLIPKMLEQWGNGYKIVWAARIQEEIRTTKRSFFSLLYHNLFNLVVTHKVAEDGVDFALIDKAVIEVLKARAQLREPLFAQVTDTGFNSTIVRYHKLARAAGRSGWTLRKKLALVFATAIYSLK